MTATDSNGCTATAQATVNVSGAIEIAEVCACNDGSGNVTFTVKLNNWPTCGGPFTVGINYTTNTMGTGILSAGSIASDPSGMKTITFSPVANAAASGNLSLSSVVNPSNLAQSINSNNFPFAVSGPLTLTCPDTVHVFMEPDLCYGLVPDLSARVNPGEVAGLIP
ncbi:MAG: hypothetical protein IPM26_04575 [Saprospiraceae bacterium]|nr:hypothetical protein [Saprospiraceae bacterium]